MERLGLAEFSPKTRGRWQTSAELHTENMLISCPSHELHPTYATTKTTAVVNSPLAPAHLVDARSAVHCSCWPPSWVSCTWDESLHIPWWHRRKPHHTAWDPNCNTEHRITHVCTKPQVHAHAGAHQRGWSNIVHLLELRSLVSSSPRTREMTIRESGIGTTPAPVPDCPPLSPTECPDQWHGRVLQ